jgi:tight adherence protein B
MEIELGQLWIIYLLTFGAVLLAVQAIYWISSRTRGAQTTVHRRLAVTRQRMNPTAALQALREERGFGDFDNPIITRLNDLLMQTGLAIDRKLLALWTIALIAVLFFILSLLLGLRTLSLAAAVVTAMMLVFLFLRRKRSQRIARFAEQFPDALDVIVRGLRVGYPLSAALGLVAKEMPDPIGSEFSMTSDEIGFGLDVRRGIENLARRVGQEDLLYFVVAVNIQTQTGGNLAEILLRLSRLVRNRTKVRLKIRSLTAEGRLSAIFLSLVPIVLFGIISFVSPTYYGAVRFHPAFMPAMLLGLAMLLIGNVIMYRMVHFKY